MSKNILRIGIGGRFTVLAWVAPSWRSSPGSYFLQGSSKTNTNEKWTLKTHKNAHLNIIFKQKSLSPADHEINLNELLIGFVYHLIKRG